MSDAHQVMPFSALVGQTRLKLALTLLAVDPKLGGVLIRGEKGTAKSTAARGLASLLPPVTVHEGCPYGCAVSRPDSWCEACREPLSHGQVERRPAFETLPLGCTADQLLGTIDLEQALQHGQRRFSPGLLARVNHGVLYVDEVNLLDDHIVDLLLDVAAMGVNTVAREGITVSHPAELMLVGTMNPEEGELRPQLTDRFGLCAEVASLGDAEDRAEVVVRRLAFDADPARFCASYADAERALAERIVAARQRLAKVTIDRAWCLRAAQLSLALGAVGHRSDVLLVKAAAALAALDGRAELAQGDLAQAATVVLPHRLRRRGFDDPAAPKAGEAAADLAARVSDALSEQESPAKKP